MALPATDSFTYSDGTLSAVASNWTIAEGTDFYVSSNQVRCATSGVDALAYWNADSFDADQYSQVVLQSVPSNTHNGAGVRISSGNGYGYYVTGEPGWSDWVYKIVSSAFYEIESGAEGEFGSATVIRLEVEGGTLTPLVNGAAPGNVGVNTDSSLTSGAAGLASWNNAESYMDDWEGGNLGAASYTLTMAQGTLTLTGQTLGLLRDLILGVDQGTITLTGQTVGLLRGFTLGIDQGTVNLTGQDVTLTYTPITGYTLNIDPGTFTASGQAINMLRDLILGIDQGTVALTGQSVTLTYTPVATVGTITGVFPTASTTVSSDPWLDNDWVTPENIYADDGSVAEVVHPTFDSGDQTYLLKGYTFDLSALPASATIVGVVVHINAWYSAGGADLDYVSLLDTSNNPAGDNKASTPTTLTTNTADVHDFGGSADLWNNSLTRAWVTNSNFGVAVGAIATGANTDVHIDYVSIDVYYTAANEYSLTIDQGVVTLTGQAVALQAARTLPITQGTVNLTGQAVALNRGYTVALVNGNFNLTGQTVGLHHGWIIPMGQGDVAYTGQPVGLAASYLLGVEQGTYNLSGQSVALPLGYSFVLEQGAVALTGQDTGLTADRLLTASQGSVVLSGQTMSMLRSLIVSLSQGSYSLTGQDVTLTYTQLGAYTLTIDNAAFTLSGQTVGLLADRVLSATQGGYNLNGQVANLIRGYKLGIDQGGYALTGQDAALQAAFYLALTQGSITLSGQDLSLIVARALAAGQGSFVLSGQDVLLTYEVLGTQQIGSVSISDNSRYNVSITDSGIWLITQVDTSQYAVAAGDVGLDSVSAADVSLHAVSISDSQI